jgi:hypothetical protein
MECQRCLFGKEAKYRVYTEAMETKVCAACAHEARRLGLSIEALDREEGENRRTASGDTPSSV